jgi:O-acetyl-ADP-ribose deacetylase (regulator of RNase III)
MRSEVETVIGDLLDRNVEAIVNAWNRNMIPWWLLLPQGVSGAIKKRGGYAPFRELARVGPMRTGDAVVTGAGRLQFRAIIHVAALTMWWRSSEEIVRRCVRNALLRATEHRFASVALPLIGAGTGGLDPDRVRQIIIDEARASDYDGRVVVVSFAGRE